MNEEKIGEQPDKEPAEISSEIGVLSAESENGSPKEDTFECEFGKFKSAEALYEAYKNLQAEFTRKCQKLSEFEKEKTVGNNPSEKEIEDGLSSFLLKNADAENYSDKLKEILLSEKKDNPFENAWASIVLKTLASKDSQKYESPIFKKYVFEDEELKNKVIEIYIKELNKNKPPVLLSSESGQRITKLDPVAPTSLKEAKKIMEDMFS